MEETDIAHIAGVLDGAGVVTVHVKKSEGYAIGYQFQPTIRMHRPSEDEALLGKIDAFCEEQSVHYRISEKENTASTSLEFEIFKADDIERFLTPLMPHLVTLYEETTIMMDTILPAVKQGKHRTKEGFLELLGPTEQLRSARERERPKYTKEHFEDLWDDELPA